MLVEIIIPTSQRTEPCLHTIKNILQHSDDLINNILIIENGEKSQLPEKIKELNKSKVQYYHTPIANKSAALNYALQYVSEESFILFFDDDIELSSNTIKAYIDAAKKLGRGYYFGGPTIGLYQTPPPDEIKQFLPASVTGFNLPEGFTHPENQSFLGFNWGLFKQDLNLIKGFDPRFGPGSTSGATGQETKAMIDLFKVGIKAHYVPEAKVSHHVSPKQFTDKWIIHRRYRTGIEYGLRFSFLRALTIIFPFRTILNTVIFLFKKEYSPKTKKLYLLTTISTYLGRVKGFLIRIGFLDLKPLINIPLLPLSKKRKSFVYAYLGVILACIFFRVEYWPFSDYRVFQGKSSPEKTQTCNFAYTLRSGELIFPKREKWLRPTSFYAKCNNALHKDDKVYLKRLLKETTLNALLPKDAISTSIVIRKIIVNKDKSLKIQNSPYIIQNLRDTK